MISCKKENYLDRFPLDALTEPTFFKNESDLKLYSNRFYPLLPAFTSGSADDNSDNMVPTSRNSFLAGTYAIPASATTASGWVWTDIRAANYFLARYDRADLAADLKNRYAAEVKVFRAYLYWQKVKQFNNVPWISVDLQDTSTALLFAGATSHKVVMDSVLEDLNFAVANLPLPAVAEKGRLHRYAALAMKARIALWEGTFRKYHSLGDETKFLTEAATAAETIINSGLYDIYSTNNPNRDYYNLFIQEDLSNNKEAILPKVYLKDVLMHNTPRQIGEANNGFSKNFVRSYLCKDGLPTSLSTLYKGDDSLDAEVANRDPRFPQTVATRGFVFLQNPTGANDTIALPRIGTAITSTGYQLAKFRSPDPLQINANQATLDLFIFRYAETLLIDAEARAELGQADQALMTRTINKLRSRVGMPGLTIASLVKDPKSDFPTIPVLIDEIRRERRIELALEGFRFDDLLRWKAGKQIENPETILGLKLHPNVKAQYPPNQVNNIVLDANGYIRPYTNITARVWNDKMYAYPLPTQELSLNTNLKQNTGW